jgi:hypothetical protein
MKSREWGMGNREWVRLHRFRLTASPILRFRTTLPASFIPHSPFPIPCP